MSNHRQSLEAEAMAALSDRFGTSTLDVGRAMNGLRAFHGMPRSLVGSVGAILRRMEAAGLVKRLDSEKPVAWLRVKPAAAAAAPDHSGGDDEMVKPKEQKP